MAFPSSLLKLSVLVYVTGSIFKMAEKNSNSDTFSRFPSSVFIDECDNIAVSQRVQFG